MHGTDRTGQHIPNRRGLSCVGHAQDHLGTAHDLADAHGQGLRRDLGQAAEPAFTELLAAAGLIQRDFQERRVRYEISGWVVEGEVAIFAQTRETNIDGGGSDKPAKPGDFRSGFSVAIDGNEVNLPDLGDEPVS